MDMESSEMISAFSRIHAAGAPDPNQLVGDIAIALVNTFWGLFIAIPGLTAFAFFRNRIDAYAAECVKLCDRIVELGAPGVKLGGQALPELLTQIGGHEESHADLPKLSSSRQGDLASPQTSRRRRVSPTHRR